MKNKDKNRVMDIIFIVLVAALLITIVIMLIYMDRNSVSCLANPVEYFESIENVSCTCQEINPFTKININIS